MMIIDLYITWARVLLLLLTSESAVRYALWWWKLRPEGQTTDQEFLLRRLMSGISLATAGYFLLLWSVLWYSPRVHLLPVPFVVILPVGYGLLVAGMMQHVIPCWQITCELSVRRVRQECLWRAGVALAAALWMMPR